MSQPQAYRIIKWHERHENAESRKVKSALDWVRIPTSHDSLGLKRLLGSKRGVSAFGAYILFVEVAAKCPVRGTLANGEGPLTIDDIAQKTGAPAKELEASLELLCDPRIGWIEKISPPKIEPEPPPHETRANRAAQVSETQHAGMDRDKREEKSREEESEQEQTRVRAAIASLEDWSKADRHHGLTASEEADAFRRLNVMPEVVPHLADAVKACRRKGTSFTGLPYAMKAALNAVESEQAKGVAKDPSVLTPESVWNRCKTTITFAGTTVPKRELTWNEAAILHHKKPWIPLARLAEAVTA